METACWFFKEPMTVFRDWGLVDGIVGRYVRDGLAALGARSQRLDHKDLSYACSGFHYRWNPGSPLKTFNIKFRHIVEESDFATHLGTYVPFCSWYLLPYKTLFLTCFASRTHNFSGRKAVSDFFGLNFLPYYQIATYFFRRHYITGDYHVSDHLQWYTVQPPLIWNIFKRRNWPGTWTDQHASAIILLVMPASVYGCSCAEIHPTCISAAATNKSCETRHLSKTCDTPTTSLEIGLWMWSI
jgi:hypothetical protein